MNPTQAIEVLKTLVAASSRRKNYSELVESMDAIEFFCQSTASSKKTGTKAGSITHALYGLFKAKSVDGVTMAEALEAAKAIKPDTLFDRTHLAYHKSKYRAWVLQHGQKVEAAVKVAVEDTKS